MTLPLDGVLALAKRNADDIAAITFIDVAVVMVAARLAGAAFKRIRQPAVVGEIVAGILLGPSLLGAFPGHLTDRIFPLDIVPFLNDLAQLGLIIFMFIVGLELDSDLMRGRAQLAASVSLASIALPFGLGIVLAFGLHGSHHLVQSGGAVHDVKLLPFVLFIGASMSVTAFPVLARILTERGMYRTPLGAIALACAAVDDVAAWTLLAIVLAVVSSSHLLHVPVVLVETAAFVAAMLLVVRPALGRVIEHYRQRDRDRAAAAGGAAGGGAGGGRGGPSGGPSGGAGAAGAGVSPELMTLFLIGILVSSFITERIGIHQIFGAFIFGIAVPRDTGGALVAGVVERLESLTVLLLLPVFFVVSGLNADIRAISASGLGQLALILLVAIGGKFLGATLAARANRVPGRRAAALGILMNTRGLTELVILNVGKSFGVLDQQLFTLLVVMAVVTTMMTEPLLRLVYPDRLLQADLADAERAALGTPGYRVLALIDDPDAPGPLIDVAADLALSAGPGQGTVVISHFVLRRSERLFGAGMSAELAQMADLLERLSAACQHRKGQAFQPAALFTDDVAGESLRQAGRLHSDAVVLAWPASGPGPGPDAGAQVAERLLAKPPCDLILVAASERGAVDGQGMTGPAGHIVAGIGDGADSPAVVELAVRLAAGSRCRLVLARLDDGRQARRLSHIVERLTRVDLPGFEVSETEQPFAELVAAGGCRLAVVPLDRSELPPPPAAVPFLLVRSGLDPARVGWEERLRRLDNLADAGQPDSNEA